MITTTLLDTGYLLPYPYVTYQTFFPAAPCCTSATVSATTYTSVTSFNRIYTLKNLFVTFFIYLCVPSTPSPHYTAPLLLLPHYPNCLFCPSPIHPFFSHVGYCTSSTLKTESVSSSETLVQIYRVFHDL